MAGTLQLTIGGYIAGGTGDHMVTLSGTTLEIARSGFGYKTDNDLIWTNFDLVSTLADKDFRSEMYKLDRLKEYANEYMFDATKNESVYMLWASAGETYRQSLVYDLTYEILSEENLSANLGYGAAKVRLAVQHAPWWEGTSVTSHASTINTLGGTMSMSLVAIGSMSYPNRIGTITIAGHQDEFSQYIGKAWVGIRDTRNGIAGFKPIWDCEKGEIYTDASKATAAGVSNGSVVHVSFATNAKMVKRFDVQLENVGTSSYDDMCGRYLVLSRMKLNGTAEIAVNLRHGWLGMDGLESSVGMTYLSAVTDASLVNYNLIPLGIVDIPPTGDRNGVASGEKGAPTGFVKYYGLSVYAERLSLGTLGSATFDCFVFMPTDHLLTIGSCAIYDFAAKYVVGYTGDDNTQFAINRTLDSGMGNVEYSFDNWNVGIDGGILVLAAQAGTIHQYSGSCAVDVEIFNRFRSYRSTY